MDAFPPRSGLHWRALTTLDLPEVEAIAAEVHPGFFERPAIFAERQRLYSEGARLLEVDGRPSGYILSHPWTSASLPALDTLLGALPPEPDTYYIHDLALRERARGTGAAGLIVAAIARHARLMGFADISLVAVNASQGFWQRQGFAVRNRPDLAQTLAGYDAAACFMVRSLVP